MKTNSNVTVTATLNADDIVTLVEDGELSDNDVVIGITEPERKKVEKELSG